MLASGGRPLFVEPMTGCRAESCAWRDLRIRRGCGICKAPAVCVHCGRAKELPDRRAAAPRPQALHRTLAETEAAARSLRAACADIESTCDMIQDAAPPVLTAVEAAGSEAARLGASVNLLIAPLAPRARRSAAAGAAAAARAPARRAAGGGAAGGLDSLSSVEDDGGAGGPGGGASGGGPGSSAPSAVGGPAAAGGDATIANAAAAAGEAAAAAAANAAGDGTRLEAVAERLRAVWRYKGWDSASRRSLLRISSDLKALSGLAALVTEPLWAPPPARHAPAPAAGGGSDGGSGGVGDSGSGSRSSGGGGSEEGGAVEAAAEERKH